MKIKYSHYECTPADTIGDWKKDGKLTLIVKDADRVLIRKLDEAIRKVLTP